MNKDTWEKLVILKAEYYDIIDYDVEPANEKSYNKPQTGRSYNGEYRSLLSSECGFDSCTPGHEL